MTSLDGWLPLKNNETSCGDVRLFLQAPVCGSFVKILANKWLVSIEQTVASARNIYQDFDSLIADFTAMLKQ